MLEFADNLPQNSHGEPTPSDNDPIPLPFNNTYNQPERDYYHYKVKYYRTDKFLVEKMLDDATRAATRSGVERSAGCRSNTTTLPPIHRRQVQARSEEEHRGTDRGRHRGHARGAAEVYQARCAPNTTPYMKTQRAARPGHVEDCSEVRRQGVAPPADRRPKKDRLRAFYAKRRTGT